MPIDGLIVAKLFDPKKHTSHFDTCKSADKHRKAKPKKVYTPCPVPSWIPSCVEAIERSIEKHGYSQETTAKILKAACGVSQVKHLDILTDHMLLKVWCYLMNDPDLFVWAGEYTASFIPEYKAKQGALKKYLQKKGILPTEAK